jgi:hypothetical protein
MKFNELKYNKNHKFSSYLYYLRALIIAITIFSANEIAILLAINKEELFRKISSENIMEINYMKGTSSNITLLANKNSVLFGKEADVITVGDSSGLSSIKPNIINEKINFNIVNFNLFADANYDGYLAVANNALNNIKDVKYLALAITPLALPAALDMKFGNYYAKQLNNIYLNKWRFFHYLPSIYFRKDIVEVAHYYLPRLFAGYKYNISESGVNRLDITDQKISKEAMIANKGFVPIEKNSGYDKINLNYCNKVIKKYFFDKKGKKSKLIAKFEKFKNLAAKHQVKLMIIFSPIACKESSQIADIIAEIDKFKKNNPDVIMPFPFINNRPKEYFSDSYHISPEGAELLSQELAIELQKYQ